MCVCAGRKWHTLSRDEQEVYYEMAKREKDMHQKMYPNWSARDNYAMHSKRKKRKLHTSSCGGGGGASGVPHLQQPGGLSPSSSCSPTGASALGASSAGGSAGALGLGMGASPGGSANGAAGGALGASALDSMPPTRTPLRRGGWLRRTFV